MHSQISYSINTGCYRRLDLKELIVEIIYCLSNLLRLFLTDLFWGEQFFYWRLLFFALTMWNNLERS